MLLLCDTETTGLSPEDDQLLEVGFLAVTDDLHPIDEISFVCSIKGMEKVIDNETGKTHYEPPFGIHETVVDMHTKNGLWDEVGITPFTVRAAEDILVAWILNASAEQLPLVGNTISFDRNFLRFHMPHLESLFHYRSLDISSIKIAANLWAPLSEADKPQQDKKHRVISDMYDSLRELEVYRAAYFIH